jgi:hypothetical protein
MIAKIAEVEGGLEEETTYDGRKLRWSEDARKGLWTMKNAYQRRRVKARVEKRARMMKLDTITLGFAREVIEEETGTPLEIGTAPAPGIARAEAPGEARLIARDDKKNPLISTFEWTDDAAQRILRVPAGFMRNKTQERVEALAREHAAARRAEASGESGTTIELGLVEEAIEVGRRIMAETIAAYNANPAAARTQHSSPTAQGAAQSGPGGVDYLNEVRAVPSSPHES